MNSIAGAGRRQADRRRYGKGIDNWP